MMRREVKVQEEKKDFIDLGIIKDNSSIEEIIMVVENKPGLQELIEAADLLIMILMIKLKIDFKEEQFTNHLGRIRIIMNRSNMEIGHIIRHNGKMAVQSNVLKKQKESENN
jgi:hypothetical protein